MSVTGYTKPKLDALLAAAAPPPVTSTLGSFSPAHSAVVAVPFAAQAGEARWDGTTWTGPTGFYLVVLKMRLADGAPAGANIAVGVVSNGSEFLTWRTLPAAPNRETLTSFDVVVLTTGGGLHTEVFVDNPTNVAFQQCDLSIIPAGHAG